MYGMRQRTPEMCFIYMLIDPRPHKLGEVRYIGQSSQGMCRPEVIHGGICGSWQKAVRSVGFVEEVFVVEQWDGTGDWKQWLDDTETFYIAYYRMLGADLTNITKGGGGTRGIVPWNKGKVKPYAPEVISAMSKAKRGVKWSSGQKKKFNQKILEGKKSGKNKMGRHLSRAVRCLPDNVEFPSIKDAARHYGFTYNSIRMSIKGKFKGKKANLGGRTFELVEPDKLPQTGYYLGTTRPGPNGTFVKY